MPVTVVKDRVATLQKAIAALVGTKVMVGIPMDSTNNTRNDGPIGNAAIGYIQETGAPEINLPARPFLVPGVQSIEGEIIARLKTIGEDGLSGKASAITRGLTALGLVAQNAVRSYMTTADFVPLSPRTVAARRRRHPSRTAAAPSDTRPLINTGQLRNALTFVLRRKV
jgi:hypothetical protein